MKIGGRLIMHHTLKRISQYIRMICKYPVILFFVILLLPSANAFSINLQKKSIQKIQIQNKRNDKIRQESLAKKKDSARKKATLAHSRNIKYKISIELKTNQDIAEMKDLGFNGIVPGNNTLFIDNNKLLSLKQKGVDYRILGGVSEYTIQKKVEGNNDMSEAVAADSSTYLYWDPDPNYFIDDLTGVWVTWSVEGNVPAGATVTNVEYRTWVGEEDAGETDFWCSDYIMSLSTEQHGKDYNFCKIWDREGAHTDNGDDDDSEDDYNIYLNWRSTSKFNGEDVNQEWYFYVGDHASGDDGQINYFEMYIYWELPNCEITVTSPNGGENWHCSEDHEISWTSSNTSGNVKIDFYSDGVWETIVDSTPDDGSYMWTVPEGINCNDALVEISDVDNSDCSDKSDASFSIACCEINLNSPAGGEEWICNNTYTITWTSSGTSGNVKIMLSSNGEWSTIIDSTPDDGEYDWLIPAGTISDQALVEVSDVDNPDCSEKSHDYFSISCCELNVTSPNGGEVWKSGQTFSIKWEPAGLSGLVNIKYICDSDSSTIVENTADDGNYNWTIPQGLYCEEAIVEISDAVQNCSDQSDDTFEIIAPPKAATGSATDITKNSARLHGVVNANGKNTNVQFNYGVTNVNEYSVDAVGSPINGTNDIWVYADIADLQPKTTFLYRIVATNEAGTTIGNDSVFTTLTDPDCYKPMVEFSRDISGEYQIGDTVSVRIFLKNDGTCPTEGDNYLNVSFRWNDYDSLAWFGPWNDASWPIEIDHVYNSEWDQQSKYYHDSGINIAVWDKHLPERPGSRYYNYLSGNWLATEPQYICKRGADRPLSVGQKISHKMTITFRKAGTVRMLTSASFKTDKKEVENRWPVYNDPAIQDRKTDFQQGLWSYEHVMTVKGATSPNAPGQLRAITLSTTTIKLIWQDNSDNENGFSIERKKGAGGQWSQISTIPADTTSFHDHGLNAGMTYYYRVRAYNDVGYSNYSNEAQATTGMLPNAPDSLFARAVSTTQINLNWQDKSNNEEGFKIEKKIQGSTVWNEIAAVNENITYYQDVGLQSGRVYYYRIYAFNAWGNSDYSNVVWDTTKQSPDSPTQLVAQAVSVNEIDVSWNDNSDDEDGFGIERKDSTTGQWFAIGSVNKNITIYHDMGLNMGQTYFYRVYAYNSFGNSGYSNEASATTGRIPDAPTNLLTKLLDNRHIELTWQDNSDDESGFAVERKLDENGQWTLLDSLTFNQTVFHDSIVTEGVVQCYRVSAYNQWGNSTCSNTACLSTTFVPAAPSNMVAHGINKNQIRLNWQDNSNNEDGFEIWRNDSTFVRTKQNIVEFLDNAVIAGMNYLYKVRAFNAFGYSSFSNSVSAKTGTPPLAPSMLSGIAISQNQINIKWQDNANDENGFYIERKNSPADTFIQIAYVNFDVTSYQDFTVLANQIYSYRVKAFNSWGESGYSNEVAISTFNDDVNSEKKGVIPKEFSISQNYPNPFNLSTTIKYSIPSHSAISMSILNLYGETVKNIFINEKQSPGIYSVVWDGTDSRGRIVPSGIYFCRLKTREQIQWIKLILAK